MASAIPARLLEVSWRESRISTEDEDEYAIASSIRYLVASSIALIATSLALARSFRGMLISFVTPIASRPTVSLLFWSSFALTVTARVLRLPLTELSPLESKFEVSRTGSSC